MGERSMISCLSHAPRLRTKPTTQACAVTGNQTNGLLLCMMTPPTNRATPVRATPDVVREKHLGSDKAPASMEHDPRSGALSLGRDQDCAGRCLPRAAVAEVWARWTRALRVGQFPGIRKSH